jgi:hypothetical protein
MVLEAHGVVLCAPIQPGRTALRTSSAAEWSPPPLPERRECLPTDVRNGRRQRCRVEEAVL